MKRIYLNDEPSIYQIDSEGNVYGKRGKLNPIIWGSRRKYLMYSFNHKGEKVRILAHRVVAMYCLEDVPENPGDFQVNHIDGDTHNNHPANLEWCTPEENINHEFATGLSRGKPFRRLEVYRGDEYIGTYPSINQCRKQLHLNAGNIHTVLRTGGTLKGYRFVECY